MDPLSALSVAAAVVQFLDFSGTIVASTYKIYKSSSKKNEGNDTLTSITARLINLNSELERSASFSPTSKIDQEIITLCQQCKKTADILLDALRQLSAGSNVTLWDSFRMALRNVWSQGEIDALQSRLDAYRQQISMHILVGLRGQIQYLQRENDRRDDEINVSLQTTQDLAMKILGVVDTQKKFQTDIIRAINRSNSWTGQYQPKTLEPHKLDTRDLDDFNARLLHILQFHEIGMREGAIADPHASTLGWLFEPSSSTGSGPTFSDWLAEDVPFYWIAGKAGSGKSTLMKHLYESPLLADRLQRWAAGDELRILCFYFWNADADIQMSLEGLVRTLLFQALEKDNSYIPICFPNRYETRLMFPDEAVYQPAFTWNELEGALKAYLQEASKHRKLFLLIDGLDEFGGQPLGIIKFVNTLPARRVKVCVSSRPWVAFEDAFGSKPSLRLDDYTKPDIRSFVEVNFRANPGFVARERLDPDYAAQIIQNVSEKAEGVFLWVSLVVRSLMEGFSGGERLSDLQERLDELPSDLEQLFLKILNKLNPKQLQRSAQFFQMLRLARRQISSLEFSFADEDSAERIYKMDITPLSTREVEARVEILARRLNECCKGLIEIPKVRGKAKPDGKVSYLHRTVSDFWSKNENKKRLVDMQGNDFNPYVRLCLARIAMLKVMMKIDRDYFWDTLIYGVGYAKAAEARSKEPLPKLFVELARVADDLSARCDRNGEAYLATLMNSPAIRWDPDDRKISYTWPWMFTDFRPKANFLALAAIYGLKSYLDFLTTSLTPRMRTQVCSIALHYALLPGDRVAEKYYSVLNVAEGKTSYHKDDLIMMLLKNGADPNYVNPATNRTAWETLWDQYDYPRYTTANAFLDAGADPDALLHHKYRHWILDHNREGRQIFDLCKQVKRRNRGSLRANFVNLWSARPKSRSPAPNIDRHNRKEGDRSEFLYQLQQSYRT
ncbi:hypothetical protein BU23DRAFT_598819 [Bimuria novae-zelandiae CBS 107.79]|uniref:NACHT domain-containing protein n=1 Tax=Bimuria novae-zelandiae CBS 107.79 TaxID=1447943 RepID=A0A6A5V979_9PLEO|nr:hypothetical protein BU23DRAFT_598819 [Bimuria novae-zelandiae CBS 107.79]